MLVDLARLTNDPHFVTSCTRLERILKQAKLEHPVISGGVHSESGIPRLTLSWPSTPVSLVVAPGCATLRVATPSGGVYVRSIGLFDAIERHEGTEALKAVRDQYMQQAVPVAAPSPDLTQRLRSNDAEVYVDAVRELAQFPVHPAHGGSWVTYRAIVDLLKGPTPTRLRPASMLAVRMFPRILRDQHARYDEAQDRADRQAGIHPVVTALHVLALRLRLQDALEAKAGCPPAPGSSFQEILDAIFKEENDGIWCTFVYPALWAAILRPDPGQSTLPQYQPEYREAVIDLALVLDARGDIKKRVQTPPTVALFKKGLVELAKNDATREIANAALQQWFGQVYKAPASAC